MEVNSMRKIIVPILVFASLLILLGLVGWYRSYVDQVSFLTAFDAIAVVVVERLWELLTNSIVLTSLAIYAILWASRKKLPAILSALEEIKAGAVSVKFDTTKLTQALVETVKKKSPDTQATPASNETLADLVNGFTDGTCWYLLKVANKWLAYNDHIKIIAKEVGFDEYDESGQFLAGLGYIRGIMDFRGLLFDASYNAEAGIMIIQVSDQVIHLIQQKIQVHSRSVSTKAA
jgi:hypothetical protein